MIYESNYHSFSPSLPSGLFYRALIAATFQFRRCANFQGTFCWLKKPLWEKTLNRFGSRPVRAKHSFPAQIKRWRRHSSEFMYRLISLSNCNFLDRESRRDHDCLIPLKKSQKLWQEEGDKKQNMIWLHPSKPPSNYAAKEHYFLYLPPLFRREQSDRNLTRVFRNCALAHFPGLEGGNAGSAKMRKLSRNRVLKSSRTSSPRNSMCIFTSDSA